MKTKKSINLAPPNCNKQKRNILKTMKKKFKTAKVTLILSFFVLIIAISCKKTAKNEPTTTPEPPVANTPTGKIPEIATIPVTNVFKNKALSGGIISSDGGVTITQRGVCWSTNQTPTIADNKTNDGAGAGTFTSTVSDLNSNTVYYLRAYATNSIGTGYGSTMSFTSALTVTDASGNVYNTIKIGNQVWMVENLRTEKYRNGDAIPNVTDGNAWSNLTTGACCDHSNTPSYSNPYGKLYNWYAVNDSRNIAPQGWRVATDNDWDVLISSSGGSAIAGGRLKDASTNYWASPNTGATNDVGFTALPSGLRFGYDGTYPYFNNQSTTFWTSTLLSSSSVWTRQLTYNSIGVNHYYSSFNQGNVVRCIKE